jgi:murein DD-endopeptidase MepM/ murein hydrolase activator NlpD
VRRLAAIVATLIGAACVAPAAGGQVAEIPARPATVPAPASSPFRPLPPSGSSTFLYAGELTQGGWIRGQAPAGTVSARLGEQALSRDPEGRFFAAFDRDAGPAATLSAVLRDGRAVEAVLTVAPRAWQIEQVNADFHAGVPDEEFTRRREPELARIVAARAIDSGSEGWRQSFIWPATGRISGRFGSQRVYRGKPGSYHSGLDIAGGSGATYVAPADGVVVLAAADPFTLEGHLLIVDHGMGLNSAFLHSSELLVREGDRVRQGQPLGKIGMTGRATGPHLHWSLMWRGLRLDPLLFVPPQG